MVGGAGHFPKQLKYIFLIDTETKGDFYTVRKNLMRRHLYARNVFTVYA